MPSLISIDEFLSQSKEFPVIDVRSESEFQQGHFPNAINIPILNDEHRKEVGTIYKQKGRQEAVIKGFDLAGGKFGDFIRQAQTANRQLERSGPQNDGLRFERRNPAQAGLPTADLLIYCWRGGMRSAIAEWILTLAGFRVLRLKGGYKIFRNWCLQTLQKEKKILVLGGKTGSGKTEILKHLSQLGECVIDLENLANHKGSAFGGLGQLPQPTTEHFENLLAMQWAKIPNEKPDCRQASFVWIENESRTIGKNQIPNSIYEQIRRANVVEIKVDDDIRLKRILNEYSYFPIEQLTELTKKLKKRLGGQHLKESLEYLEKRNLESWAKKMLDYYDKTYAYGMFQREKDKIHPLILNGENYLEFAKKIKEFGNSIMKNFSEKEYSI